MSPTVFRYHQYRFFFFSREEPRIHVHVHVTSPNGEAKFWLEPRIELALNQGMRDPEIHELLHLIQERHNEIREHWHRHFGH